MALRSKPTAKTKSFARPAAKPAAKSSTMTATRRMDKTNKEGSVTKGKATTVTLKPSSAREVFGPSRTTTSSIYEGMATNAACGAKSPDGKYKVGVDGTWHRMYSKGGRMSSRKK